MRKVTAAVTQMSCSRDREENLQKAEDLVRQAAEQTMEALRAMKLPELDYFMEHFLPAFALTLDELSQ